MYIFDKIIFPTSGAAEKVLIDLKDNIRNYGFTTISDLYDLVGLISYNYTDNMYGWNDLNCAEIELVEDGYRLVLPDEYKISGESKYNMEVTCGMGGTARVTKQDKPGSIVVKCSKPDMVNHPAHYKSETGMEVIDVIEAFTFDLKGIEATDTGNVIKYICRWHSKNGLEDLKKAQWYLNHLIAHVEKMEKEND